MIPLWKEVHLNNDYERGRIESELEVKSYLDRLKYALLKGARIDWQVTRAVDRNRNPRFTNWYTMQTLFPGVDAPDVLRRELQILTTGDYIQTVKDTRYPNRSEMREFGKVYNDRDDVYIKLRVELLGKYGDTVIFVMSFHFSDKPFTENRFPYRKKGESLHG